MKVIHVHLIFKKKDYYFGSLSAVFDYLNESDVGIMKNTLLHRAREGTILTKTAIIRKSTLLRSNKNRRKDHDI